MTFNQKIAIRIKEERAARNWPQHVIADSLEISQKAYSKLENGEVAFRIERLLQLSTIFTIPLANLLPIDYEQKS
jgi:transcriptional regulator with XRE-family HTH domain